jgi:hypothetical protein
VEEGLKQQNVLRLNQYHQKRKREKEKERMREERKEGGKDGGREGRREGEKKARRQRGNIIIKNWLAQHRCSKINSLDITSSKIHMYTHPNT